MSAIDRHTANLLRLAAYHAGHAGIHVGACRVENCTSETHEPGTIGDAAQATVTYVQEVCEAGRLDFALGEWERDPDEGIER